MNELIYTIINLLDEVEKSEELNLHNLSRETMTDIKCKILFLSAMIDTKLGR